MKKLAKMILTLLLAMGIGPVMSMDNVTPKYHEGAHAHTPQSLVEWIENRVKGQLNFVHDPSLDKRILFGQDRDDLEKAFQDLKIMYGTQEIPQAIKERIIEIAKDLGLDYWVDVFEKSGKASTDPTEQLPEEILSKILVQAHPQTLTTGPQIGTKWNASSKRDPDFQDLKLLEHVHMNNGVIDLGKGWEDKISPFGDNVTDNLLQRVIERFPDVQILWIDSSQVSDMNPLVKTHNLQILNLTGKRISDLKPLSHVISLQELNIRDCTGVITLDPLKPLINLSRLSISNCPQISSIDALKYVINLTQLTINNNPELRDLSPLLNLQHLSFFSVISCPALQQLPSLATLSNLTQIVFEDCAGITDLGQLGYQGPVSDAREEGGNNYLQNLHLLGCPGIKDLTPLRKFTNLKYINIWGCPGITKEMVDSFQMDMPDLQIIFDPSVYEKGKLIG